MTEVKKTKPGWLYRFLKRYCRLMLHQYFSKYQIQGSENVPDGPVVFAANHSNAFLDAVLVACSSHRNPWFVTRSDVFKRGGVRRWLFRLRMFPVYRFRDGYTGMKRNDEFLNFCVDKLKDQEAILIFAEGNHGTQHRVRPLQRGVARIALSEELKVPPVIVPVGLYFESIQSFRTRVLVNFGTPIKTRMDDGTRIAEEKLLTEIRMQLESLILHVGSDHHDRALQYLNRNRVPMDDMTAQLHSDRTICFQYQSTFPVESKGASSLIRGALIPEWYTKINLFVASWVIHRKILSRIPDPQFTGSVKFSTGMVLTPVTWGLQGMVIYLLSGSLTLMLLYLFSLPLALNSIHRKGIE